MATQNQKNPVIFFRNSVIALALIGGLSACQSASTRGAHSEATPPAAEQASQEVVEKGPEYVDGLGFFMTWEKTDASLITAPQAIKDEVLALCQERGFVRFFMRKLLFTTDQAEGYFDCTGASSN